VADEANGDDLAQRDAHVDELANVVRKMLDEEHFAIVDRIGREATIDAAVKRRLVDDCTRLLDEYVQKGELKRLSGGRYRTPKDSIVTAEEIARAVFPKAFREPVRVYSRWEDAAQFQLGLLEFSQSYVGREYLEEFEKALNAQHPTSAQVPEGFLHATQLQTLANAEPCYVSNDVCELIDQMRHSFQIEQVRPSDPFCEHGFMLLAKPIMLHDAPWNEENPGSSRDGLTPVRIIAWTSIHSEDYEVGSFWVSFYNHFDDDPGHHEHDMPLVEKRIHPMLLGHTFQWSWGDKPIEDRLAGLTLPGENPEHARFRAIEQSQLVQTTWRLAQQFVPVKRRSPRPLRREAKRRRLKMVDEVNVVLLRRQRQVGDYDEGTGRQMNVTIWVDPYWATRHTREGAKQVLVGVKTGGFLRGQGPFKERQRAWEFRR
jgi:hypothetical protein